MITHYYKSSTGVYTTMQYISHHNTCLTLMGTVVGSLSRAPCVVVVGVAAMVVMGIVATTQHQGPLACWTCSGNIHGQDCYDLDPEDMSLAKTCSPDQVFCTVNRIWYVVEAGAEPRNFSVNRTCASACSPSCVVIGDRTKIHSCTSCCTTSHCNTDNSASSQVVVSIPLVVAVLLLGGGLTPLILHPLPSG